MNELNKQQTILIVDDAKENINILAELLRPDFKIRAVTNGEKALEISNSDNPPDLVLLDVMMPGMDGYEVCRRMKANPQTKNIPIIFVTGKTDEEDQVKGFKLGAIDYITKPFSAIIVKARVGMHAELQRYRNYLENISYLDGLTGICNRRKFDEYLEHTWNLGVRLSMPVSMILMDIDFFKQYNDIYGHQEGDNCLIQIAQALSKIIVRKTDFLARYGGEEFVCILPNTPIDDTFVISERLRESVSLLQIPHSGSSVEKVVTISAGVASQFPSKNSSFTDLIKAADKALYRAKETGRNKTSQ